MRTIKASISLFCLLATRLADGFSVTRQNNYARCTNTEKTSLNASRRSVFEHVSKSTVLILPTIFLTSRKEASASGGATAGGVYLLSAKQRYNTRVTSGVVSFRGVGSQLESGDIDSVRLFFTSEEIGSWKDFTASGYLLANAFRRSSNTPPDSLPSVKKWKAFAAEVENITKCLKKKDTKGAIQAYTVAMVALDEYLEKVELPPAKEVS